MYNCYDEFRALSAAIRRGDTNEAEYQLDLIVRDSKHLKSAVDQGRIDARQRDVRQTKPLRNVA